MQTRSATMAFSGGAILICDEMQDFLIGNGHGTSTMWRFCGAFRRPDYHWEKAAGFEDWLRDHPGKDAWVPRVRAAFDRKARFNNRTFGEWESISREPGFALIASTFQLRHFTR